MSLRVRFSSRGLTPPDVAGSVVFVVDILRATTTMCAALHHGAKAIIPVDSAEEAMRLAQTIGRDDMVLAGERNCLRIEGFTLGNSPREMTPEMVQGRTVVLTTTNGTRALLATQAADEVFVAAASNITAIGGRAHAALEAGRPILILCAGREDEFALDDAYCAGRIATLALGGRDVADVEHDDATIAALDLVARYRQRWDKPLRASTAGRNLVRLGMGDDVADAARTDAYPVLAHFHERRVLAVRPAA
jgi:2-phosphosulfolactate phosphatase